MRSINLNAIASIIGHTPGCIRYLRTHANSSYVRRTRRNNISRPNNYMWNLSFDTIFRYCRVLRTKDVRSYPT